MIRWLRALFNRRSKAELLDQVAAQQELIRHLLSKPVMQLAKLAYRWTEEPWPKKATATTVLVDLSDFIEDNADALRCLKGDDDAPA